MSDNSFSVLFLMWGCTAFCFYRFMHDSLEFWVIRKGSNDKNVSDLLDTKHGQAIFKTLLFFLVIFWPVFTPILTLLSISRKIKRWL